MTLPHTGGTEWAAAQATPWTTVNQTLRRLDANVSRSIIEDRDLTAAPGACADGARYLVAATPGGGDPWAGQTGKLAIAVGVNAASGWLFQIVAVEGFKLFVRDENVEIHHNGTAWVANAAIADLTTTATAGTLPTPNGTVTIADAATPTVVELLEYCVELEAKLEAALARLRAVGIILT